MFTVHVVRSVGARDRRRKTGEVREKTEKKDSERMGGKTEKRGKKKADRQTDRPSRRTWRKK